MIRFSDLNIFDAENTDEFAIPKYIERRGFIYIMQNKYYPEIFKIGRTTNLPKRLLAYNENQPSVTTKVIAVSNMLENCHYVESRILAWFKKEVEPIQYKKEWFDIKYMDKAIEFIEDAEKRFTIKE